MADNQGGIKRLVQLVLDKAAGRRMEQDAQKALNKATDPSQARRNISLIDGAIGGLKRAAVGLGAAFAGAFAAVGITRFAQAAIGTFAEAEAVWNRLAGTLRTAGVEFGAVRGEIEKAARAMQDVTTVGDDDFAQSLQTLVRITGDYQGSLKNVRVVADLAAGAQIDLGTASQLVGKAMVGNTAALSRYGIVVKEGENAVDAIARRFKGMAENEANTLQGRIKQINNEWGDFKEAIGAALVQSGGDGVNVLTRIRDGLKDATEWVNRNAEAFRTLGSAVVDFGTWVVRDIAGAVRELREMYGYVVKIKDALPRNITRTGFGALGTGKGPGRNEDMRSDNERERSLGTGAGAAGSTTPPRPTTPPRATTGTSGSGRTRAGGGNRGGVAGRIAREAEEEWLRLQERVANFENQLAGRGMDTLRSPGISTTSGVGGIVAAFDAHQAKITETADVWRGAHADMESASQALAANVFSAWEDTIGLMLNGTYSVSEGFEQMGRSMVSSTFGALAEIARANMARSIADAWFFFSHGNVPGGTTALIAAGKYGALSAIVGGAGGAFGGGGGARYHQGGGMGYGREAATKVDPQVHVYLYNNPFDGRNPVIAREVGRSVKLHYELSGRPDWAKE